MIKLKTTCILFLLCSSAISAQIITNLEIYYLPWVFRPDAQLEAEDVRNFNHGKNSYVCIQDTTAINEFIRSMSVFYLTSFPELKKIDHVMVIDIYFEDGSKKTMGLNARKHIVFLNTFYYKNFELIKWMDKYIPPAKIPK